MVQGRPGERGNRRTGEPETRRTGDTHPTSDSSPSSTLLVSLSPPLPVSEARGLVVPDDIARTCEHLIAHSLVRAVEGPGGAPRFTMLETVREYAGEQLRERGEAAALQRRHAAYWADWAEMAEPHFHTHEQLAWLALADAEQENIRAALTWAEQHSDDESAALLGLRIAVNMEAAWGLRGHETEQLRWLSSAPWVHDSRLPAHLRALALTLDSVWGIDLGYGHRRDVLIEEATALARESGDPRALAFALYQLPDILTDAEKRARLQEGLAIARTIGHEGLLLWPYFIERTIPFIADAIPDDPAFYEWVLARTRAIGDRGMVMGELYTYGNLLRYRGNYECARENHLELLHLQEQLRGSSLAWGGWYQLGWLAVAVGDMQEGYAWHARRLEWDGPLGNHAGLAHIFIGLAEIAWAMGEMARARDHMAEADTHLKATGLLPDDPEYWRITSGWWWHGWLAAEAGEYVAAQVFAKRLLEEAPDQGINGPTACWQHWLMGVIQLAQGNVSEAQTRLSRAIALTPRQYHAMIFEPPPLDLFDPPLPLIQSQLALAAAHTGDEAEARARLMAADTEPPIHVVFWRGEEQFTRAATLIRLAAPGEALPHLAAGFAHFRRCGSRHRIAWGLELTAQIVVADDPAFATRLWGAAATIRAATGCPMWPIDHPAYDHNIAAARETLGDAAFDAAWNAGAAMPWETAANEAMAWIAVRRDSGDGMHA